MTQQRLAPRTSWCWNVVALLFFGMSIGYGLGQLPSLAAAVQSTRRATTEGSGVPANLEEKLNAILASQDEVLERLDGVMEELRIIKIRASMQ